jgi:3-deoxy-manno-octulosonate cytidylyltransferase (CMP-KDO synthetase)
MIQRVYEQARKSNMLDTVVVATDHHEIFDHVKSFGGEVCMTRENHVSGTDRCFEALEQQSGSYEYLINVQGDEPFIQPGQIDLLADRLDGKTEIATLIKRLERSEDLFNPNLVKVVVNLAKEALYFSRSPIPHIRNRDQNVWISSFTFYKHIGMYAYRTDILEAITQLPVSELEKAESLEQLRWLEHGYNISVAETTIETMGIDTPDDLQRAVESLRE